MVRYNAFVFPYGRVFGILVKVLHYLVVRDQFFTVILVRFAEELDSFRMICDVVIMFVNHLDNACAEALSGGVRVHKECTSD